MAYKDMQACCYAGMFTSPQKHMNELAAFGLACMDLKPPAYATTFKPSRYRFRGLSPVQEHAVTSSEAKFLEYIKTKPGMPDASELERLRDILDKMQWQHLFTRVKPRHAGRS